MIMAGRKKAESPTIPTNQRTPNEYEGRFGAFQRYVDNNPDKDFIIINHAKGEIQRHEMKGWRIVKNERLYTSEFEELTGESAGQSNDGFAHLPCGIAGEGKATFAVLMWAPKGTIAEVQKRRNEEARERKSAYSSKADQAGAIKGGNIETYDPRGGGGLTVDTVSQGST